MHVCNKIDVLLSTYILMAELGCWLSWVDGWVTHARVAWCFSFISHTQATTMLLRTIWAALFGITILCNVGVLKTDETIPLFLDYVPSFTDVCDNNTVHWFMVLLTKDTCDSLSLGSQQWIESWWRRLGCLFLLSRVVERSVAIELQLSQASAYQGSNFLCQTHC